MVQKDPSDVLKLDLYRTCTQDRGTISYKYLSNNGETYRIRENMKVPKRYRQALKNIESTLDFKWDRYSLCWNVVHKRIGQMPYIIMHVKSRDGGYMPINDRVFEQIRRSIWWSSIGIKRQARIMENEAAYRKERDRKKKKETSRDYANEMAYPLMNALRGNSGWNTQSNFLFAGHGESKVNAKDQITDSPKENQ